MNVQPPSIKTGNSAPVTGVSLVSITSHSIHRPILKRSSTSLKGTIDTGLDTGLGFSNININTNSYSSRSSSTNSSYQQSRSPSFCAIYNTRRKSSLKSSSFKSSSSYSTEESLFDGGYIALSSSVCSDYSTLKEGVDHHPLSMELEDENNQTGINEFSEHFNYNICEDGGSFRGNLTKKMSIDINRTLTKPIEEEDKDKPSITRSNTSSNGKDKNNIKEDPQPISSFDKLINFFRGVKYPLTNAINTKRFTKDDHKMKFTVEVPLETFHYGVKAGTYDGLVYNERTIMEPNLVSITLNGKSRRFREERINPDYLRNYAIIHSIERSDITTVSEDELNVFDRFLLDHYDSETNTIKGEDDPHLFEMELQRRLNECFPSPIFNTPELSIDYLMELKLLSLARHKLWTSMILAPRSDDTPSFHSISDDILPRIPYTNGIQTKKIGMPWISIKDISSRKKLSGIGINGNKSIQFVSKGGESRRFSPLIDVET